MHGVCQYAQDAYLTDLSNRSGGSVIVTTEQGYFSRLWGSAMGVPVGALLTLGGCALQWYNETRYVEQRKKNDEYTQAVPLCASDALQECNAGQYVHLTGALDSDETLRDGAFGVNVDDALYLGRRVERMLYEETKRTVEAKNHIGGSMTKKEKVSWKLKWCDESQDGQTSQLAEEEGYANPSMKFEHWNKDVHVDALTLAGKPLRSWTASLSSVIHSGATDYTPPFVQLDGKQDLTRMNGSWYFYAVRGSSSHPDLGDVRVKFRVARSGLQASVVGLQVGTSSIDLSKGIAVGGSRPLADMVAGQRSGNSLVLWLLRLLGSVLQYIGMKALLDPVVTAAVVLPILSKLVGVGTSAVAIPSTVAMSIATIAIGWVNARIDFWVANTGLKGIWAVLVIMSLKIIFQKAAAAVAVVGGVGASAVTNAGKAIGVISK